MPNHFIKSRPAANSAVDRPDQLELPKPMSKKPGFFSSLAINKAADHATRNIEVAKINNFEQEMKATNTAAAAMAGQEMRLELGRVHSAVIGAIGAELLQDHLAVGLELKGIRFSGSVVNIKDLVEQMDEIQKLLDSGEIDKEYATALLNTAKDLHVELEGDIDGQYNKTRESVRESFNLATDPVETILNRLKGK